MGFNRELLTLQGDLLLEDGPGPGRPPLLGQDLAEVRVDLSLDVSIFDDLGVIADHTPDEVAGLFELGFRRG